MLMPLLKAKIVPGLFVVLVGGGMGGVAILSDMYSVYAFLAIPCLLGVAIWLGSLKLFLLMSTASYFLFQGLTANADSSVSYHLMLVQGLLLLLLLRLVVGWCSRTEPVSVPAGLLPMLLFIAVAVSGLLRAQVDGGMSVFARHIAVLVVFISAYVSTNTYRDFSQVLLVVELICLFVALSAIYDIVTGADNLHVFRDELRARGALGSPIEVGNIVVFAMPILIFRYLYGVHALGRIFFIVSMSVVLAGLFSSFTRRSFVALLVLVVGVSFFSRKQGWYGGIRNSLLMICSFLLMLAFGLQLVDEATLKGRLDDIPLIGDVELNDPTAGSGRFSIWTLLLLDMQSNSSLEWLFGHGFYMTHFLMETSTGMAKAAHNTYLELIYTLGLLGLLSYLLLMSVVFWSCYRLSLSSGQVAGFARIWAIFIVAYLLSIDMFGSAVNQLDTRWLLFLITGSLIGYYKHNRASGVKGDIDER